ncbi:MAG TPA: HAMP domain-containing sensor histidine kinase [Solirubrobacterales bacterium]|nr:HAMP domain-containing sensor histidine kinase [Solirubrobacterales bacterium]
MKWANPRRLPLFERIPVRWRIAVTTAGLTLLILVVFALVLGQVVGDRIRSDFRSELRNAATSLADETKIYTSSSGQAVVDSPRIKDFAAADKAVIRIYDAYGHPLIPAIAGVETGSPQPGVHSSGDLSVATEPITTVNSLTGERTLVGYVQYARSPEGVNETVARLWLFLGAGVLGGTVLALLAGLAVADRAMRPIKGLTGLARQITSTRDPSKRIPAPPTDDEVGELARTMDGMLQALDEARSEREQALERQREFVADASHELRTPLTSIQANLELLHAEGAGSDDDRHAIDSALSSTKRMSGLVSDLLLLARADAGRQVARTDIDLTQIAAGALEEVEPLAGERHLESHLEGPLPISGNPDELHRMIRNLLENAVRHTPEKTTVELTARQDGDEALLEVLDDGPGIPAGIEEHLFDRFVHGDGPADTVSGGGTGLGLAIVRAVAQSHGGSVDAGRSAYGGARFSIRLPLEAITEPAAAEGPEHSDERQKL